MQLGSLTRTTLSLPRCWGGREVPDGSCVLGCGLDTILSDHEPGKLNLPPGEPELFGIEHQTVLVTVGHDASDPHESSLHRVQFCDDVVNYLLEISVR